jgi:glycosyltransferase involved in cell wall biosynthesis
MDHSHKPTVTVFIASTVEQKRAASLKHAIESVLAQESTADITLCVIVNGNRFSPDLVSALNAREDIDVIQLEIGSYPATLAHARHVVSTEYFCFVDDDDELTPGSIEQRILPFMEDENVDVVVGNGLRSPGERVMLDADKIERANQRPLNALFEKGGNWLASCSGLFKTASIPEHYFDDYAVYAEWSYLAVKLSCFNNVKVVSHPCYIINLSETSLSQSTDYVLAQYAYLFKLDAFNLPPSIQASIAIKKTDMEHEIAGCFQANKQYSQAWGYHLRSLRTLFGLKKYLLFTRHMIFK